MQELDKFVGNTSAARHVKAIIDSGKLPNAILFYGKQGTGKTTLARILAKHFAESELNVFEYNSAFLSGVENARNVAKIIETPPLTGKYRIFIFDECHRATPQFYDVLLKPMEDSEFGRFILCTTEFSFLQKFPTVASRCVKIKTSPLNLEETKQLIAKKLGNKISSNKRLVELVYALTGGIPRDILICCAEISRIGDVEAGMVYLQEHFFVKKGGNLSKFVYALLSPRVSDDEFEKLFYSVVDKIQTRPEEIRRFIVQKLEHAIMSRSLPVTALLGSNSNVFAIISEPWYDFLTATAKIIEIRKAIKGDK